MAIPRRAGVMDEKIGHGSKPGLTSSQGEKHPFNSNTMEAEDKQDAEHSVSVIRPHGGVTKVEAFNKVLRQSGSGTALLWILCISIGLAMFAYSIDQGTTYIFNTYATSAFERHSELAAVNTAGQVIRAISVPFLGKLADITSRPTTYVVVLMFYAVGFAVAASAQGIASYTVGTCFTSVGKSGLDFLGGLIVADLTNLQWRGFYGSLLSLPFLVTAFIDGFISGGFLPREWRWGLGMFAIMVPVLLTPAIITLYFMELKAKKLGMVSLGGSVYARTGEMDKMGPTSFLKLAWQGVIDIDLAGLVLLGTGFALILLSLSLYPGTKGGFSNPSMIAMIVVGFVVLGFFILYEYYVAPKPCCSRNIWNNKAFVSAIGIDVSTQLSSGVHSTYFASYILVVKQWSLYNTNLFTNMVLLLLCFIGPLVGLYMAKTHRFKFIMFCGAVLKLIGEAILLNGNRSTKSTAVLIISQVFAGMGAFTVVGARVGSQASVPHKDLASIIAQLSLWSTLASAVGYAIAGAIWQNQMLPFMRQECPSNITDQQLLTVYSSIATLRDFPLSSTLRQCGITAYTRTNGSLFIASTCIAILSVLFCFLMPNYYLGKQHNVVANTRPDGEHVSEEKNQHNSASTDITQPVGAWGRLKHFWLKEY